MMNPLRHKMKKKTHKRITHTVILIALILMVLHHAMALKKLMRKKHTYALQDKMEHLQHCFERLMEHR